MPPLFVFSALQPLFRKHPGAGTWDGERPRAFVFILLAYQNAMRRLGETASHCSPFTRGHKHLWKTMGIVAKVEESGRLCCVPLGHEKSRTGRVLRRSYIPSPDSEVGYGDAPHRELHDLPRASQLADISAAHCNKKWRTILFFNKFVWSGEGGSRTSRSR